MMKKTSQKKLVLKKQTLSHLQLEVAAGGATRGGFGCSGSCISGCNTKPTYDTNCTAC